MKRRGHPEETIRRVVYDNPLEFFRQSRRWREETRRRGDKETREKFEIRNSISETNPKSEIRKS
jgi:hypothetical protein